MVTRRRRTTLRGYTDLTVMGAGPLWTLYRAFDIESSQWVAMRWIRPGALPDYLLDELETSIGALQTVHQHPNVETVHRIARPADGSLTMSMELCRGSYRDRLAGRGPIGVDEVVSVAQRVAAGLQAAADVGLVHGGLGPSNLLRSHYGGVVVVGGFGLAPLKLATRDATSPVSPHTAPEVVERGVATAATDVYAMCSTMYELLSGQPPFRPVEGETPASLLLRIVAEPTPPLRVPEIPRALVDLIESGLSKDPSRRPATPRELGKELSAITGDRPDGERAGQPAQAPPAPAEGGSIDVPTSAPAEAAVPPIEPGVAVPESSGRNVLTPITSGRGSRPVQPRPGGPGN